ncbi:uncharacterized protein [Rutidosis leptorrhynchoides]|uniref:uncharacterized protein n=1 Tax=Rutidosis leptorrhynchoides TaxID=125765 RepID=UPI003A9A5DB4
MSVRVVIQEETYMVICAYAPHAGLGDEEKSRFWESLDEVVRSCPVDHRLLIGGDLNGYIGTISDGYTGVHGGFGYGVRNEEGRSILEFAVAHDLVVANSFFRKTEAQLATFHSGGHSTQIDYLLLRKGDLRACKDCRALTTWTCSTQHRLLVMDLVLQRRVTRRVRPAQPRILWKNLNEGQAETFKASVLERVEAGMDTVTQVDADKMIAKARERRRRDVDNIKFIKDEAGQTIVKEEEIRKRWEWYFSSLFVGEGPGSQEDPHDLGIGQFQNNNFCRRISQEEVRSALRKMGRNKAVGPDQIPIEAWRCLGEDGVRWLTCLFNKTLRCYKMPTEWRLSEIIPIYKNKGDAQICENQFGFKPGLSTMEAIHILRSVMEKYREKQKGLEMALLDLEKAYDSVPRKLI